MKILFRTLPAIAAVAAGCKTPYLLIITDRGAVNPDAIEVTVTGAIVPTPLREKGLWRGEISPAEMLALAIVGKTGAGTAELGKCDLRARSGDVILVRLKENQQIDCTIGRE